MVALFRHLPKSRLPVLIRAVPWAGAVVLGIVLFLLVVTMQGAVLASWVSASGITVLVPVAYLPLSGTARLLVGLGAGGLAAVPGWAILYLLFGPGGALVGSKSRARGGQTVRRADAHPDAPPRRPLSAAHELAAPPIPTVPPAPVVAVQPLPVDLDTSLASIDPHSILPVPREAVRPVRPLASAAPLPLRPAERLATVTPTGDPAAAEVPSVEALLRRLDQEAGRRVRVVR